MAEVDARVTVAVTAGTGYLVDSGSGSAGVDVYDNDAVASAPVETVWTSTLEWQGDYGAGWVNANEEDFSSPGWSEDGHDYRIWYVAYGSSKDELWVRVDPNMRAGGIPEAGRTDIAGGQCDRGVGKHDGQVCSGRHRHRPGDWAELGRSASRWRCG